MATIVALLRAGRVAFRVPASALSSKSTVASSGRRVNALLENAVVPPARMLSPYRLFATADVVLLSCRPSLPAVCTQPLIVRPPLKIYGRHSADAANALAEVKIDANESVGTLAISLVAVLHLGVAPNRVVLTVVDEDGAIVKVLTDAKATLETAGVTSGATVVVSMAPDFPVLPPPLVFDETEVGGELMMVAELPRGPVGSTAPFFLTLEQYRELSRFIDEEPTTTEQLLMASGTIKSGKTKVVLTVLPGLLSAAYADTSRWPSARLRPVIFTYSFPLSTDAEAAAMDLQDALASFGRTINIPFDLDPTPRAALANLHTALFDFASRIRANGGELWQFWDELQAPVLGSTPAMAENFIHKLKHVSAPRGCRAAIATGRA